jgi:ferredoxin
MFSNGGFNNGGRHNRKNTVPSGLCVCPKCGYTVSHNRGVPCSSKSCPVCKSWLVRSSDPKLQSVSSEPTEQQVIVSQPINVKVSQYPKVDVELCVGCGACVDICPVNAIVMNDDKAFINEDICRNCQKCVRVCPVGAIL